MTKHLIKVESIKDVVTACVEKAISNINAEVVINEIVIDDNMKVVIKMELTSKSLFVRAELWAWYNEEWTNLAIWHEAYGGRITKCNKNLKSSYITKVRTRMINDEWLAKKICAGLECENNKRLANLSALRKEFLKLYFINNSYNKVV